MIRPFLSFCVVFLCLGCSGISEIQTPQTFPEISADLATARSFDSCGDFPADRNQPSRSPAISLFDGFASHIVRICSGSQSTAALVFWSKTNDTFTRITGRLTTLDGREIPFTGSAFNPAFGVTTFDFSYRGRACSVVKPRSGVSPAPLAICR